MRKLGAVLAASLFGAALAAACSSGGGGGASGGGATLTTAQFCDLLRSNASLGTSDASLPGQSASNVASTLEDVAKRAPDEIRGDLQLIVDAVRNSGNSLSDFADPTKSAAVASSYSSLNDSISEARQHIAQFSKDKCGVDLDSALPASSS